MEDLLFERKEIFLENPLEAILGVHKKRKLKTVEILGMSNAKEPDNLRPSSKSQR